MLSIRFILFALILAVAALWLSFKQTDLSSGTASPLLKEGHVSWQVYNSTAWQLERRAPQKNTVTQAERIIYWETEHKSELTRPFILVSQPSQTLSIQSQSGRTFEDRRIEFEGNVTAIQNIVSDSTSAQDGQNRRLKTERLFYNAETSLLRSDQPVVLYQPGAAITGTGLKADLKRGHYQLLSNVKGTFIPQTQQAEQP